MSLYFLGRFLAKAFFFLVTEVATGVIGDAGPAFTLCQTRDLGLVIKKIDATIILLTLSNETNILKEKNPMAPQNPNGFGSFR